MRVLRVEIKSLHFYVDPECGPHVHFLKMPIQQKYICLYKCQYHMTGRDTLIFLPTLFLKRQFLLANLHAMYLD